MATKTRSKKTVKGKAKRLRTREERDKKYEQARKQEPYHLGVSDERR